ncbi:hypothetical protein EON77_01340, partial [bacterium]
WGPTDYGYNIAYVGGYGGLGSRMRDSVHYDKGTNPVGPLTTQTPAKATSLAMSAQTILFADSVWSLPDGRASRWPWLYPPSAYSKGNNNASGMMQARHNEQSNIVFLDTHVKSMRLKYVPGHEKTFRGTLVPGNAYTDEYWNGEGTP